jgi:TfoX/Sxy family transcriptional regulator of competence genes
MAYDEALAERLSDALSDRDDVRERRMFGGIAFMVAGNMAVGVVEDRLMVRVGPDAYETLLDEPHARPMDFTGRPMKGFVYVESRGLTSDADLRGWVDRGVDFALSLPAK